METSITTTSVSLVNNHGLSKPTLNGTAITIMTKHNQNVMAATNDGVECFDKGDKQSKDHSKIHGKVSVVAKPNAATVSALVAPHPTLPRSLEPVDQIRKVSTSEYKEAARTLALAFAKDHVARYFFEMPDTVHWTEKQKWDLHVSILEYTTYLYCLKGLVTTVGKGYGCVALW
jgi:hypothetical protein